MKIPKGWRKLRPGQTADRMCKYWNFLTNCFEWWDHPKTFVLDNGSAYIKKVKKPRA